MDAPTNLVWHQAEQTIESDAVAGAVEYVYGIFMSPEDTEPFEIKSSTDPKVAFDLYHGTYSAKGKVKGSGGGWSVWSEAITIEVV